MIDKRLLMVIDYRHRVGQKMYTQLFIFLAHPGCMYVVFCDNETIFVLWFLIAERLWRSSREVVWLNK